VADHLAVSVIIPCHDAEATIERALCSVARQTIRPAEVVVANDASTDGTERLLTECRGGSWPFALKVVHLESRGGPAVARNAAWGEISSASRLVAFLDADDVWLPRKLEIQAAWMDRHPEFGWSAHACGVMDGSPACQEGAARPGDRVRYTVLSPRRMLFRNAVATPTVMARCPTPSRFRGDWDRCEDLMLWLDWLDAGFNGALLTPTLALLGRPPKRVGGLTGDLRRMFAGELRIFDTLVTEHRMSANVATLWKIYANGRFRLRTLCG
jgi:teichuronic acid biosynthesis glycosyltransferase TuaG